MATKTRRQSTRQQSSRRRRTAARAAAPGAAKPGPDPLETVRAQRARYYALKRAGMSNVEAAEKTNQEARQGTLERPRVEPRAARAARGEEVAEARLRARTAVLRGRDRQHDPVNSRTPKAGRVARMMTPDGDELGTPEEQETSFRGAMVHTHEGRHPPTAEVADADTYHQGDETVNDQDSKRLGAQMLGGRRARQQSSGSQRVPSNWQTMSLQRKRALVQSITGDKAATRESQVDAILRREARRQERS